MARQYEFNLDTPISGSLDSDGEEEDLTDYTDDEIEMMFERAITNYPESAFLESIYDHWHETGELSAAQWQGLQNSCLRVRKDY